MPNCLEDLLGYSSQCSCGHLHQVDTQFVHLRTGAIAALPDMLASWGKDLSVLVVTDRVTRIVAGEAAVRGIRKAGYRVSEIVVPDGSGRRPHATDENVELVRDAAVGVDAVVAVGSGTINDLCKLGSFLAHKPYLVVATAPSMNGYTSAIAAIMSGGLKRTVECHQPHGVIADLDILSAAPAHLILAGLGDLESKPSSTADYLLSSLIRGTHHCEVPGQVVLGAERRAADAARGIGQRDPAALKILIEALLLSGFSMKLAGSSSPASGGEHLISHHWDMTAHEEGRVEGWHGAQVGVATIVTTTLYGRLRQLDPSSVDVEKLAAVYPSQDMVIAHLDRVHGRWAAGARDEFLVKRLSPDDYIAEVARILGAWREIWAPLGGVLRSGAAVRGILTEAGAPVRVGQLGLTRGHLERSYILARELRGRYTVLDFAAALGVLEELSSEVLGDSGCLVEDP